MFKSTQLCGNLSRNCLPQLEFNEFHIFFHNLRKIFSELRSRSRKVFRVWIWAHIDKCGKCASHYKTKMILSRSENMTRFYRRVRLRTLATLRFCTFASMTGLQFICAAKHLQSLCTRWLLTLPLPPYPQMESIILLAGLLFLCIFILNVPCALPSTALRWFFCAEQVPERETIKAQFSPSRELLTILQI
jgi:hypothetical protein